MAENKATAGNTTRSGGAGGAFIGGANGRLVLGDIPLLGELVYKFNTRDQAEMYLRTTKAIAAYVGVEYGKEMMLLVNQRYETEFTEPDIPTGNPSKVVMERYKMELGKYHKEKTAYEKSKAKVFAIILGQCSEVLKSKLEDDTTFKQLQIEDDVIGFLDKLKSWTFSTSGSQHPVWCLQRSIRRMVATNQGQNESVTHYYNRFMALAEVTEAQWGKFYPPKLALNDSEYEKEQARQQFLALLFLDGADKDRYQELKMELNNSYLAKKDNYPATLDDALKMLTHYQDNKRGHQKKSKNGVGEEEFISSFAQKKRESLRSRIQCWNCKEFGHVKSECPHRRNVNTQVEDTAEQVGWSS